MKTFFASIPAVRRRPLWPALSFVAGVILLPVVAQGAPRPACPFERDPAFTARTALAPAGAGELAAGTLNLYRLFDAEQDGRESVRLTAAQFAARTARIARYVADDMGAPALLAVQEVEDDTALRALAAALRRETGRDWHFLVGDKAPDSDIRSGLLLDARIRVLRSESLFAGKPYERGPRFDRLPLVAELDASALSKAAARLTVVVVHLKSQRGLDQPEEAVRVREKRRSQAARLAAWTRARASGGERLLVLGDFNAPAPADAGDPVRAEPLHILLADGGLADVAGRFLRPAQRWTYRYGCSLQQLDHVLVSPSLAESVSGYGIARGDTCLRARERCRPDVSVSDHEGVVLRLH